MSSISGTLSYLYGLQQRGMKLGLRNVRSLLREAGHPERRFPSIHIAGTNGKGSTAAFLASIMMESGAKTGLYTSPHLIRFNERIRINGVEIPDDRIVGYVRRLKQSIDRVRATFFEATTCIAFMYFSDEQVDIAIIETGLGGRLDATNLIHPIVSVITNVSLEHQEQLGNTIKAIAREKGGIIKRGVPCVTGARDRDTLQVLKTIASRRGTRVFQADRVARLTSSGGILKCARPFGAVKIRLRLGGSHQIRNARLALAAVHVAKRDRRFAKTFPRLSRNSIQKGFRRVHENTGLRGRLEVVKNKGVWVLDVAHNAAGIETLVAALRSLYGRKLPVVFGVMEDKDVVSMARILSSVANSIVAVVPHTERAMGLRRLLGVLRHTGVSVITGGTVAAGLKRLVGRGTRNAPVVVTGSHYVVGEAIDFLERHRA